MKNVKMDSELNEIPYEVFLRRSLIFIISIISRVLFIHVVYYNLYVLLIKVKVNCTLVQALRLCTGLTAHRRSRGIALSFHDHGTGRG